MIAIKVSGTDHTIIRLENLKDAYIIHEATDCKVIPK